MEDAPHWTPRCCWVQELTTLPCKQSQKCRLITELPCLESSSRISSRLCQNCLQSTQNLQHPAVAFLPFFAAVSLALGFPVGCWAAPTTVLTRIATCFFSLLYLGPYLLSYSFIWKLSSPRSLLSYYRNLHDSSPALLPRAAGIWDSSTPVCRVFPHCNISPTSSSAPVKECCVFWVYLPLQNTLLVLKHLFKNLLWPGLSLWVNKMWIFKNVPHSYSLYMAQGCIGNFHMSLWCTLNALY